MLNLPGKRVRRTRLVRTDRFIVEVDVEAIALDLEPGEIVYGPDVVELLREVEARAKAGDIDWLRQHGKVFQAVEAA